jgi:hypothetical protein
MGCKGRGDSWELKRGEIGVEADGVAGLLACQGGVQCGAVGRDVGRQSTAAWGWCGCSLLWSVDGDVLA